MIFAISSTVSYFINSAHRIFEKIKLGFLKFSKKTGSKEYFQNSYKSSKNFKSLSFENGLVVGNFRETSYVLKIRPGNYIETKVLKNKLWEPHVAQIIAGYLNEPDLAVIDVGANIGATSIPLAKHFTSVKFFLFEPHPSVFQDLKNNISYNKLLNVEAHNIAITDRGDSFLPFYAQKNTYNFGLSSFSHNHDIKDHDVIEVKCRALDSIFKSHLKLKVLKVDTQGHELNVLLSASELVKKHKPIILFEFESEYFPISKDENDAKESILKFFNQHKYELYMIESKSRYLPKLTLKDYYRGEILAVPLHEDF